MINGEKEAKVGKYYWVATEHQKTLGLWSCLLVQRAD